MKMIDVLKRLAELDANNPNVVTSTKTNTNLKECGQMGMAQPQNPASLTINATAANGSEVSGMLMDIMKLAGVHQVDQSELGTEHEPVSITIEPIISATPEIHGEPEMGNMVDMIDRINDDEESEEETDEGMWDNSPADEIDGTEGYKAFQDHGDLNKNPAMGGDVPKDHEHRSRVRNQPTATMEDMEAQLFAEYREFVAEGKVAEKWDVDMKTPPAKKGMFKGKTKEQLEKQLAALKKKGPHKKDSPEYTKMKELQFAIRAKKKTDKWGKVSEGLEYDEEHDDGMSVDLDESKWKYGCGKAITTYVPRGHGYKEVSAECGSTAYDGSVNQCDDCAAKIPQPSPHEEDDYSDDMYETKKSSKKDAESSKLDGSAALLPDKLKRLAGLKDTKKDQK